MLRRHKTTIEYLEEQNTYVLDVDGFSVYLTIDEMTDLTGYIMENDIKAAEDIAFYLKDKAPQLFEEKLIPLSENPNAYDIYEVLKCQLEKPVHTQKPSK